MSGSMIIKQISVFIENKKGRLASFTKLLADHGFNLRALSVADTSAFGILRIIVEKPEEVMKVLEENRITARITDVVCIPVGDKPGSLAKTLKVLDEHGIDVEYTYAFLSDEKDFAYVVMKVEDPKTAAELFA